MDGFEKSRGGGDGVGEGKVVNGSFEGIEMILESFEGVFDGE